MIRIYSYRCYSKGQNWLSTKSSLCPRSGGRPEVGRRTQSFRSTWLHGHPVSRGGMWMLGSQRRLRVAEVVSLHWGPWWGLFRGFLLALLSMALSSYTDVFLSWVLTSILTQSLGSQEKGILWGLCIPEWQDLCHHNNGPCLYGHITCMTSTHLPLFQRLQQQANPVTTPKHTLSHLFPSWATQGTWDPSQSPLNFLRHGQATSSLSLPRAGNIPHSSRALPNLPPPHHLYGRK